MEEKGIRIVENITRTVVKEAGNWRAAENMYVAREAKCCCCCCCCCCCSRRKPSLGYTYVGAVRTHKPSWQFEIPPLWCKVRRYYVRMCAQTYYVNLALSKAGFTFNALRPHPHEPKTMTFWDKLAHFSGKISPEKLAGWFVFSFRTALKMEINSRLNP